MLLAPVSWNFDSFSSFLYSCSYKMQQVLRQCCLLLPLVLFVRHEEPLLPVIFNLYLLFSPSLLYLIIIYEMFATKPLRYNTGFGSALSIETLVAAAEKRDAPIEVPCFIMYRYISCKIMYGSICWFLFHHHIQKTLRVVYFCNVMFVDMHFAVSFLLCGVQLHLTYSI